MFRYTAEILPYHDYSLEDAPRAARRPRLQRGQPLDLGKSAGPPRQPGRRHRQDQEGAGQIRHESLRADDVRQEPAGDAGAHPVRRGPRTSTPSSSTARPTTPTSSSTFLPPLVEAAEQGRRPHRGGEPPHRPVQRGLRVRWQRGQAVGRGRRHLRPDQAADQRHRPPQPGGLRRPAAPVGDGRNHQRRHHLSSPSASGSSTTTSGTSIWPTSMASTGSTSGPGDKQLPRPDGRLDHAVLLGALKRVGYDGAASLKCHGTAGWPINKVTEQLRASDAYVRSCLDRI